MRLSVFFSVIFFSFLALANSPDAESIYNMIKDSMGPGSYGREVKIKSLDCRADLGNYYACAAIDANDNLFLISEANDLVDAILVGAPNFLIEDANPKQEFESMSCKQDYNGANSSCDIKTTNTHSF